MPRSSIATPSTLLNTILLPWFFLTPIFYTFEALPGIGGHPNVVKISLLGQPADPDTEAMRDPLFSGTLPRPQDAIYAVAASALVLGLAAFVFRRADDQLAGEL